MAKIASILTEAGIVRSQYGVAGGIVLNRSPAEITLLDIVQACQGLVIADYCQALGNATSPEVCAFHQAMHDLHTATIRSLSRWTLKMLAARPVPRGRSLRTRSVAWRAFAPPAVPALAPPLEKNGRQAPAGLRPANRNEVRQLPRCPIPFHPKVRFHAQCNND